MDFTAGWVGGIAGTAISHPLDTLRTLQATNRQSLSVTARKMFQGSGMLHKAFSGIAWPCMSTGAWKAIVLSSNQIYLGGDTKNPPLPKLMAAASMAGATGGLIMGPFELLKTRSMVIGQMTNRVRMSPILRELQVIRSVSPKDFLRSMQLLILRDSIGFTGYFIAYEAAKRIIESHAPAMGPAATGFIGGLLSGPLGWFTIYPIEIYRIHVQTRAQAQLASKNCARDSVMGNIRAIQATGWGPLPWFRGCLTCCLRASLQIPVTMGVFEYLRGCGA